MSGCAGGEIRLGGLDKRLKLAEGHIEAGRLLALYQVLIDTMLLLTDIAERLGNFVLAINSNFIVYSLHCDRISQES